MSNQAREIEEIITFTWNDAIEAVISSLENWNEKVKRIDIPYDEIKKLKR